MKPTAQCFHRGCSAGALRRSSAFFVSAPSASTIGRAEPGPRDDAVARLTLKLRGILVDAERAVAGGASHAGAGAVQSSSTPVHAFARTDLERELYAAGPPPTQTTPKALWDGAGALFYRHPPALSPAGRGGSREPSVTAAPSADAMIVPFAWRPAVAAVAEALPHEGVQEAVLARELAARCTAAAPASAAPTAGMLAHQLGYDGVRSLAHWVRRHFPDLIFITRSAATGEALFYNRKRNNILPVTPPNDETSSAASAGTGVVTAYALQHALHLLGRDCQLPVWTDFMYVAALLPTSVITGESTAPEVSSYADTHWLRCLHHPTVRALFDVDAEVGVRWRGATSRELFVIDRTSVTADEAAAWLQQMRSPTALVKVLVRDSASPRPSPAQEAEPAALVGVERVVVNELLEPEHVLAALVSTADVKPPAARAGNTTPGGDADVLSERVVRILCADQSAASVMAALVGVERRGLQVIVHTPATEGVVLQCAHTHTPEL